MPDDTRAQTTAEPLLTRFPPPGGPPAGRVLVLPALGVPARFYGRLAEQLAARGLEVAVLELRGTGESPLTPARHCDFGFRELLDEDIPAALRTLRA
ncbi:MAG: alpha/beta hydrolase, partial [Algiphilus sp.]